MENELIHYGVPGMKWGHRKAQPTSDIRKRYDAAKADYKSARKTFNKSYNKAYNYSYTHPISQYVGKKAKVESDRRWNKAIDDAQKSNTAKKAFKQAKNARKTAINKAYEKVNKSSSFGEKMLYNSATRKKAAKLMTDHNMSMADAKKKANGVAIRNTAIYLAALGGYAAYSISKNR
jgi:hypothetical protein